LIALPDINVLLALAWSNHPHHDAAHHWFARDSQRGGPPACSHRQAFYVSL